ncbi:MAG: chemotaxis protein CheW [Gemmatimonadota bacterium]|nr:chemotaxis protein CheW [Gemmatimonadota bacterium]
MMIDAPSAARTLLFRVGDGVYGCDIDGVREIIPYRRATRLPGAPAYVQGLINLRGTIVTVLDIGVRLDPARAPVAEGSIIMAIFGARVVGVAVDEVMDVQPIVAESIATSAPEAHPGLVRGLGHLDDGVVILVDIHMLITQVLL